MFIKIIGLILIFFAFSGLGFYKSFSLKQKQTLLLKIFKGTEHLAELLRTTNAEKQELLEKAYGDVFLKDLLNGSCTHKIDASHKQLLNDFISELGKGDTISEYNRAKGFAVLFEKAYTEQRTKTQKDAKLYSSVGVLGGIALCIFFF